MDILLTGVHPQVSALLNAPPLYLTCFGFGFKAARSFHFQLQREPRPFPRLVFKRQVTDINDFKYEDFVVEDYKPHPKIQMDMAV